MLWLVVALAGCVAVVARLVTLRRRPEIWWISLTLALVSIFVGAAFLANEAAVNQALGTLNVAYLLSCLAFTISAGATTVYMHTLQHQQPKRSVVWGLVAATGIVCLTLTVLWVLAPVHTQEFSKFRDIPLSPVLIAFECVFHLLFLPVNSNVAAVCFRLARDAPATDPARRFGLYVNGSSNLVVVLAQLLYLARAILQPVIGASALAFAAVADLLTVIAVLGMCTGTTALLAVPHLLHVLRSRQLARTLRPLWTRTLELYPAVSMRGGWRIRNRSTYQAERMLIEIADGLRLLPVPDLASADPYRIVAEAFRQPDHNVDHRFASEILPTPTSRLEEEEQMLRLAHHYTDRLVHAS